MNLVIFGLVGYDNGVGGELSSLLYQEVGIAAGTEHFHFEEVTVPTDDIESLCADRTRRT